MSLLHNRPLALACLLLVCVVFLSLFLGVWFGIALFILAGIAFVLLLAVSYKKRLDHRRLTLFLVTAAVLLGALRVSADHLLVRDRWEDKMDTTVVAELRIKEIRFATAHYTELSVDAVTLDGERMAGGAILRADSPLGVGEGDRIRATCDVRSLDFENDTPGVAYTYLGDGARAVLVVQDTVTLTQSGASSVRAFLAQLRAMLSYRIRAACGEKEGSLLSAMLLGTRSSLPEEVTRDFTRSGVSHLLALSGLHLSLIVLLFDHLLMLFRIEKKYRIPIILVACVLYLILTGFSYSMLRAVFMLLFVYLAYFVREEQDSITILSLCAALILLVTPTAIFSVSFRLTFLATFGILVVSELTQDMPRELPKQEVKRQLFRVLYGVRSSLIVSVASLLTVLVIQWLTFGELSLITPLANLLLVPLAPSLLVAAILALLLPIAPIGLVAALPARLVLSLVAWLSKSRAVLSLGYDFVPYILIPLFVATAILLLVDLGRRRALVCVPAVIAVLAFAVCLGVGSIANGKNVTLIYNREKENEGIVLTQGAKAVICDVSSGDNSVLCADIDLLREENITEVEALVLTHYHEEHVYNVSRLCSRNMVRSLLLPIPTSDADAAIMTRIKENAEALGVSVSLYHYDTPLALLDGVTLTLHVTPDSITQKHAALAVTIAYEEHAVCYHTATDRTFPSHDCAADTLLLGAHAAETEGLIALSPLYKEVFVCKESIRNDLYTHGETTYQTVTAGQKFDLSPE